MRIRVLKKSSQAVNPTVNRILAYLCFGINIWILVILSLSSGCSRSVSQTPVLPPVTYPLSRDCIGYGVVNVSFTHFYDEVGSDGASQGYLRRGAVVRVIERRPLIINGSPVSWVFIEGNYQSSSAPSKGWLEEENLDVYDNESRAITASQAISQ